MGLLSLSIILLTACGGVASPQGWAGPQFADGTLLASLGHNTLVAADLQTNSRDWTFPPSKSRISLTALYGTPAVAQQTVLVGGYDGTLYALNLSDGAEKWSQETQGRIIGGPVVGVDTVYVGSADGCLYAFALDDGSRRFDSFCTGAKIWSTPAVANDIVYFTSMDKKVYAIDAATGEPKWTQPFKTDGAIASSPVVDGTTVYVGSFDNWMYALDASNGELRWRFKADDWIWDRALVDSGSVYFGSLGGRVYGLNASDGKLRWEKAFQGEGVVRGAPAIVGSTLVVGTDQGNVYGLEAATGKQVWASKAASGVLSDLVVNSGAVYFTSKGGVVQKVDPTRGTITDVQVPE